MEYLIVTTQKSSLKVYSTSNSNEMYRIGTVPTGTMVEIIDHRTVNNVEWVKLKTGNISGWAIMTHPSINQPLLQKPVNSLAATEKYMNEYNSAVERQNNTSSVRSTINTANKSGTTTKSGGEVPDIKNNRNYMSFKASHRQLTEIDSFEFPKEKTYSNYEIDENDIVKSFPQEVQNAKAFPVANYDTQKKRYTYDYYQNYGTSEFIKAIESIKESHNIIEESTYQLAERYAKYYNRFKIPTLDDKLTKTFAHVFFTRPDCNIIYHNGSGNYKLSDQVSNMSEFVLEYRNNINTLIQLSKTVGMDHDFMMLPSNRVTSFECKDRGLESDTYGKTRFGHTIAYGKQITGNGSNEVSISFTDDRNLSLLKLHHLWARYIHLVRRGTLRPLQNHLANKELDYAASAYYIVCAENGEDIIYWSKLYGIFPTSIPDSVMSWNKSQYITDPEINITYQYSWQNPWHPGIITEFDLNSTGERVFLESYNKQIMGTGNSWVGAPYIEIVKNASGRIVYKLRFRRS